MNLLLEVIITTMMIALLFKNSFRVSIGLQLFNVLIY